MYIYIYTYIISIYLCVYHIEYIRFIELKNFISINKLVN